MESKSEDLEWLEEWAGGEVPAIFETLPSETIHAIRLFIEKVYENKLELVRKAIRSNEVTLKFIPTFIIVHILKNFIEPEMAAIIAETLSLNLTLPIIKGLDVEYIAQAAIYLRPDFTAQILGKLTPTKANQILNRILELNPLKVLDILSHLPSWMEKSKIQVLLTEDRFQNLHLSPHRKQVLETWIV
ncbi:MAG: hypothetical protein N3A69_09900 [Leptospiraceae bacterium]|nr:hypothetical protein [Leptospiraceae bacterium]